MFKSKKTAIIATVLFFVAIAVGAGWGIATYVSSSSDNTNHSVVENPRAADVSTKVEPGPGLEQPMPNLDGEWSATAHGTRFTATVGNNVITIVMTKNNTSVMYWNGSFEQSGGDVVPSNKIETGKIVLSGADSKNFTVGFDTLSFELQAMGMTEVVVLTRA